MSPPAHPAQLRLRAFEEADLAQAAALSARAFDVDISAPALAESWRARS
jgi:hypothetical protein